MIKKLKGVAVGAGYFSQFHFEAWQRIDLVELTAICDLDVELATRTATQYEISRTYTDFVEMLDKESPDFVDIITRPDSHLPLAEEAMQRGIPVICQKPLAPTFADAQKFAEISASTKTPLMVHDNFRFQPWYREIKRLFQKRRIGDKLHSLLFRSRTGDGWQPDAYLARQPYFRTMEKLLILETGVHFIDTFRYLAGEIDGVYATLRKLNASIAGEDAGTVLFEFADGAQGIWDANRFNESNCADPRYTFGQLLVEGNGGSIRLYEDGRMTIQTLGGAEKDHEYVHARKNFASDCVFATQQHFVTCLLNGEEFETSVDDYLKTLAVQEAIYESASSGLPVRGLCG